MTTLVTGAAGFIGAYVCRALAARGEDVYGVDAYSAYYDPRLKRDRAAVLCPQVPIAELDLTDREAVRTLFAHLAPKRVLHLAAQPGVRYSIEHPHVYADANLVAFLNVLEGCRHGGLEHLVFASSSSVYGGGAVPPFAETQRTDRPLSLYAATKIAGEAMAHSYAHLYRFAVTGLRLFTVYGPWGRPDMAPVLFSRAVLAGRPIELFNHGRMRRDFTHVEDIVAGVLGALDRPPADGGAQVPPYRVFNLGHHQPVELEAFVAVIERAAGRAAIRHYRPMQPGDMVETLADVEAARAALGFDPRIAVEDGMPAVVAWCRDYYRDGGGGRE